MRQVLGCALVTVFTLFVLVIYMWQDPDGEGVKTPVQQTAEKPLWEQRVYTTTPSSPRDRNPDADEPLDLERPTSATSELVFTEEKVPNLQDAGSDSTGSYVMAALAAIGATALVTVWWSRRKRRPHYRRHRSHRRHSDSWTAPASLREMGFIDDADQIQAGQDGDARAHPA